MTEYENNCEITSDGRMVWINDNSGCCVGRFGKNGIDVHHSGPMQMDLGEQCLEFKIGPTNFSDWRDFQGAMKRHYRVMVKDAHMPKFLSGAAS